MIACANCELHLLSIKSYVNLKSIGRYNSKDPEVSEINILIACNMHRAVEQEVSNSHYSIRFNYIFSSTYVASLFVSLKSYR